MKREDWKQEIPTGFALVHVSGGRTVVEVPLGRGKGRLVLRLDIEDERTPDAPRGRANFDLSWKDRPGDPVTVSPEPLVGKEYLTHAALDLGTGELEIQPGW